MRSRTHKRWSGLVLMGLICVLFAAMGCQDNPQDKLREGRVAIAGQNADLAESRLNEALQADPNLIEARRLMADVHILRKDYQKAEEALESLWKSQGFDDESKTLEPEQRRHRQLINEKLGELYRIWAEELDSKENPDKFEEVLRKGVERDPRSTRLNTLLVDHFLERAERYLERGEKLKAAEELEKISGPGVRTFAQRRQEATTRAGNLRREAFTEAATKRFEAELKDGKFGEHAFDEDNRRILITVNQDFGRAMTDVEAARGQARPALAPQIAGLIVKIGDLQEGADMTKFSTPNIAIVDESLTRGAYSLVAAVPVDGIIESAFAYQESLRRAAAAPAGEGQAAEEQAAEEQAAPPADEKEEGAAEAAAE